MINISDQWKHIMLTLPDNYFFELMKNYMGRIETPFNKHNLVDRLANFLVKNGAEEKILGALDEREILVLTSIEFIERPTAKSIFEFFLGEIAFIELCDCLKTLEEKLIIYSDNGIIYISPLLSESVNANIINPGLLYRSEAIIPSGGNMIWLTDSLILSFLSFLIHQKDLIKSGGAFKKKAYNQIDELFPGLFSGEKGSKKLEQIRRIIHNLRLFRIDETTLIPRESIWKKLMDLPKDKRWLYMASAATTEKIGHLGMRITTVKMVIDSVPETRSFYPDNLKKLIKALNSDPDLRDNESLENFIDDLITLNILQVLNDGTITRNPTLDMENLNPDYGDTRTLILQPNFDITYKPWITLKDGYLVALFSTLKKMDIYTELAITRDSVIRGLTIAGLKNFTDLLDRVTASPVPDNILLTLKEWEKESTKALHYEASVLILDDDKDYIVKETGVIDHLILLNPAKGIYLIRQEEFKTAKMLLESVDIIPVDKNHSIPFDDGDLPGFIPSKPLTIQWEEKSRVESTTTKTELKKYLRDLSASKEEKEDLEKRIDRGIIFTKEQISPGISKTDFSEAKGINYQAKLRLIEVSLKSVNDRLEINFVEDFTVKKELVLPLRIEKQGDNKILHGIRLPQEISFSIDISKISLVRRIQTTLF